MNSPHTLVLAFGASELADDPAPFNDLAAAFPDAVLLGCSTSGEIAGTQVHDASISVAVARFEHTALRRAVTEVRESQPIPGDAGARLAGSCRRRACARCSCSATACGVNGTPLVDGLTQNLPPGVAISGGLAGDGSRFVRTWVLDGGEPAQQRICAVGFYGRAPARRPWLRRRLVGLRSRAAHHPLRGQRAVRAGRQAGAGPVQDLPGRSRGRPARHGAAVSAVGAARGRRGEPLVRTILGIDEQRRSLTFAGDMPQGGMARLMRANNDRLIESAGQAVAQAAHGFDADRGTAGDLGQLRRPPPGAGRAHRGGGRDRGRRRALRCRPRGLLLLRRDLAGAGRRRQRTAQPDDDGHRVQRGRASCSEWARRCTRCCSASCGGSASSAAAAPERRTRWPGAAARACQPAYLEAEQDRYLLERSQEIASREMSRAVRRAAGRARPARDRACASAPMRCSSARAGWPAWCRCRPTGSGSRTPSCASPTSPTACGRPPASIRPACSASAAAQRRVDVPAEVVADYESAPAERRPFRDLRLLPRVRAPAARCLHPHQRRADLRRRRQLRGLPRCRPRRHATTLAEQQVLKLARYDGLTGLPNRSMFVDELERTLARARRSGQRLRAVLHRPGPLQEHQRQPGPRCRRRAAEGDGDALARAAARQRPGGAPGRRRVRRAARRQVDAARAGAGGAQGAGGDRRAGAHRRAQFPGHRQHRHQPVPATTATTPRRC